MNIIAESLSPILLSVGTIIAAYLPKFIAGLLILFIGLIVASLLRDLLRIVFRYIRLERWLSTLGVAREKEVEIWPNMATELLRWVTIFIFLMSAVDVWGVPKVGDVLQQLLLFLPNVLLAVVIGWVGLVAARFSFDIVRHGVSGIGDKEAYVLGNIARYSIIFFTALIILTQLGVAAELVKILFTGIVGMLALAFGLSFGLGGQDEARDILKNLRKKVEKKSK